ncbi:MAG: hypothetical protein A3C71_02755 [Candidatus Yanofskybacteria bacterium RIFCSPHIGHO2_02_FULL_43_15c]|uniref:Polymerase nucleotidyl transferase domain-containing protein n=2 Tax=Candidatus Yanofskyibacteriota TaxID=1752733 RepID=A0A1F8EDB4_9BACT|nr:MAG: hypothetical protein A2649_00100 [Candidatus Yanofskybacteria bacterium RIFCSPHIGHO2_01_FULL_41_26]OGN12752.1 MAG: hypothetical protein A3C71_02755 [Candidatus Yanofskybacteria bacterium RIFCSPHIGHO2_02_FULL_43_15c]OGN21451.1 MAG: hypothetical protein A2915_02015 [Candidatus Yanofskybacteria bacterium RIFCSPLOWO2_01_FULL_41_34]
MRYLRDSIIATLVYYDIFDFPLTVPEINKYLINPERLSSLRSDLGAIQAQIRENLDDLASTGDIGFKDGFYFLPDRDALYKLRIEREAIAVKKWKKLLKTAKWFQAVPFLRAVLVSGSMAINNTDEDSDFDVLAIAKSGRLYTCRMFLSLVASLFGVRRTRYEKIAPDKFCFNHYITDGKMNIRHESLFNAQTYANLKPVFARDGIFGRFYAENIWLEKYIYNSLRSDLKEVPRSDLVINFITKFLEFILNSKTGDWLEKCFKAYQHKRIKNNPATYESGGRVVFNDNELEFHPRSFEAFAINKYNKKLKQLGIVQRVEEKDSGLTV